MWKTFKEEAKKNIPYGIFEIKQTLNHITMSEKHRNLPPWMVKSDVQSSKNNESVKKKTRGETTKRIAKKRLESVVAYWMNERELVETALSLLKDDEACAKDATQAPEVRIIPETDEDMSDSDVQDRTYVSNIAEQETVPYESTSTKPDCHPKPPSDASGASEKPEVDDEALELVREIFFT